MDVLAALVFAQREVIILTVLDAYMRGCLYHEREGGECYNVKRGWPDHQTSGRRGVLLYSLV
jgi:hypothetical protein